MGGGTPALPVCPSLPYGEAPPVSVVAVFTLVAVSSGTAAAVLAARYNSVRVFTRQIRTDTISNTLWIQFYAVVAARAGLNAVRFGVGPSRNPRVEDPRDLFFFLSEFFLNALSAMLLAMALNHQLRSVISTWCGCGVCC